MPRVEDSPDEVSALRAQVVALEGALAAARSEHRQLVHDVNNALAASLAAAAIWARGDASSARRDALAEVMARQARQLAARLQGDRAVPPAEPPPTRSAPTEAPGQVVLVEDDDDLRALMVAGLTARGHRLTALPDGHSGLAALLTMRPTVVLLDLGLPDFDGLTLARALRAQPGPQPRLIALTGDSDEAAHTAAKAAGFDAVFVKPVSLDRLDELLRQAPSGPLQAPPTPPPQTPLARPAPGVRPPSLVVAPTPGGASEADWRRFIARARHDLRSPIQSLDLIADLLEEDEGTGDLDPIALLRSSGRRLRELLPRALFSLDLSMRAIEPAPVDLDDVLEGARVDVGRPGRLVAGPLPTVLGDALLLERVLIELLDNALRYQPADGDPEVRVQAISEAGFARITVSDNGIGIDPAGQARIFDCFTRLHPYHVYQGVGLGLWIARQIVEAHGGVLEIESGRPATFVLRLPLA